MPFPLIRLLGLPKGQAGRHRVAAVAGGLAVALLTSVPALADTGSATTVTATAVGTTATTVGPVTGDHAVVTDRPGQLPSYAVQPAADGADAFTSYDDASGDHYAVPVVTLPYLGQGLDISLFVVTRLAQAGDNVVNGHAPGAWSPTWRPSPTRLPVSRSTTRTASPVGSSWGGTSASALYIVGIIALAGNPGQYANASSFYSHTAGLNDIVGGNTARTTDCGGDYQCNAVTGYDGPTGNGTPDGLAAF